MVLSFDENKDGLVPPIPPPFLSPSPKVKVIPPLANTHPHAPSLIIPPNPTPSPVCPRSSAHHSAPDFRRRGPSSTDSPPGAPPGRRPPPPSAPCLRPAVDHVRRGLGRLPGQVRRGGRPRGPAAPPRQCLHGQTPLLPPFTSPPIQARVMSRPFPKPSRAEPGPWVVPRPLKQCLRAAAAAAGAHDGQDDDGTDRGCQGLGLSSR